MSSTRNLSKRVRADESTSMENSSICKYRRCEKRVHQEGDSQEHQFCGKFHRDLFNSEILTGEFGNILRYNGSCNLPGCNNRIDNKLHDFCRKKHVLTFIEMSVSMWRREGRLCNYQNCTSHVYVHEGTKQRHDYCGFSHAKRAAAARGLMSPEKISPDREDTDGGSDETNDMMMIKNSGSEDDSSKGYDIQVSDADLENALTAALLKLHGEIAHEKSSSKFATNINLYDFHPWDLFCERIRARIGGATTRYILGIIDGLVKHPKNSKKRSVNRKRTTKEGFGWKQSARPYRVKSDLGKHLDKTYFGYEYKPGKSGKDHPANSDPEYNDHIAVYRRWQEQPGDHTHRSKRWKMTEICLKEEIIEKTIGTEQADQNKKRPVIWKVFEDLNGGPVWPPPVSHGPRISLSDNQVRASTVIEATVSESHTHSGSSATRAEGPVHRSDVLENESSESCGVLEENPALTALTSIDVQIDFSQLENRTDSIASASGENVLEENPTMFNSTDVQIDFGQSKDVFEDIDDLQQAILCEDRLSEATTLLEDLPHAILCEDRLSEATTLLEDLPHAILCEDRLSEATTLLEDLPHAILCEDRLSEATTLLEDLPHAILCEDPMHMSDTTLPVDELSDSVEFAVQLWNFSNVSDGHGAGRTLFEEA